MPRATKKKKERAVDFSKAKLRLGKGKKLPANQVDTSFKARSITLPTQSIALQKDTNVPATKRKLTLTDLVSHLKHHNSNLFEAHSELLESACVRLIGDEDASVRRALISFFTWLLPRISPHDLTPHSSNLLLFTTSAQTHIFPEIQLDAVRFLDLYLESFPDAVVCGWRDGKTGHGRRILEGYLSILSAGTKLGDTSLVPSNTVASLAVLSTASKLVVFRSMSKFLRVALSSPIPSYDENFPSTPSSPTWCFFSAFSESNAYDAFDALFRPTINPSPDARPPICQWKAVIDPNGDEECFSFDFQSTQFKSSVGTPYMLQELCNVISSTTSDDLDLDSQLSNQRSDFEMRLARALHPVLLSNFLDSAPSVFSPSSAPLQTELGIVSAIADIYRSLYSALLRSPKVDSNSGFLLDSLQVILERMAPHFPFLPSPLVRRDIEQALQNLNIVHCELTSLLILAYTAQDAVPSNLKKRDGSSIPKQVSRVKDYIAHLLSGVQMSPHVLGRHITAQDYVALVPTLWMLLNSKLKHSGADDDVDILKAVSSLAATKRPTVDFLARLILVGFLVVVGLPSKLETAPRYIGTFKVNTDAACLQKFEQWILHLPKTLWELGDTDISCTEIGAQLCARLIPYFTITHPLRGTLPGPFTKLGDSTLQRLVLDMVATIAASVPAESREPLDTAPVTRSLTPKVTRSSSSFVVGSTSAHSILSPATTGPTPAGVPVSTRSPSSSVMIDETCWISRGIRKIMCDVLPFCLICSLTYVGLELDPCLASAEAARRTLSHMFRLWGSPTFDFGM
ncbi:hypothetical protein F5148DRAFT_1274880 [Russula earlei]|uniref:Uncharacterized protein n=1 Tax=Russula earlei TaxID=71964 RepID=A0ACC0UF57_9AGAM|nr:hypothetical protein F5148DRAFT_1274880 [Russula earlei]